MKSGGVKYNYLSVFRKDNGRGYVMEEWLWIMVCYAGVLKQGWMIGCGVRLWSIWLMGNEWEAWNGLETVFLCKLRSLFWRDGVVSKRHLGGSLQSCVRLPAPFLGRESGFLGILLLKTLSCSMLMD